MRSKKWRRTGSVFSLPTECLWDCTQYSHGLRQAPCSGSVVASEGQNFSPVLSPVTEKEISPRKNILANFTAASSPPHRHRRATLECFFPYSPLHSYPQNQAQSLALSSSPHKGDKPETAPAGCNTHLYWNLCGAFNASFLYSPLP